MWHFLKATTVKLSELASKIFLKKGLDWLKGILDTFFYVFYGINQSTINILHNLFCIQISEPNYGEQVNRQNSILSEISAKELAEVFLNDLTDNVSVYLEDILDELLQNNNNDDNKDLQS